MVWVIPVLKIIIISETELKNTDLKQFIYIFFKPAFHSFLVQIITLH